MTHGLEARTAASSTDRGASRSSTRLRKCATGGAFIKLLHSLHAKHCYALL